MSDFKIINDDCIETLLDMPDEFVDCCVTSPPYWGLRDYGVVGQIGLEKTIEIYIQNMDIVFREVKRVLKPQGTLWLNLGDSYYNYRPGKGQKINKQTLSKTNQDLPTICHRRGTKIHGLKEKDLIGIPWRVAFKLQQSGWYLRSDIIWHKTNSMPESVLDRPSRCHEYVFLLTKNSRYYYDHDQIREPYLDSSKERYKTPVFETAPGYRRPDGNLSRKSNKKIIVPNPKGKNKRSVWKISSTKIKGSHYATFPEKLVQPCILAGCPEGGLVLDPFSGSGTTGIVANKFNRNFIGIELNSDYVKLSLERAKNLQPVLRGIY